MDWVFGFEALLHGLNAIGFAYN